jgi:hypothetical protein
MHTQDLKDFNGALTIGQSFASMLAKSKRKSISKREGTYDESPKKEKQREKRKQKHAEIRGENEMIPVFHTRIPVRYTDDGVPYAINIDTNEIESSEKVRAYMKKSFGNNLQEVIGAMNYLANAYSKDELNKNGFKLYEKWRPGTGKWGAKGTLQLRQLKEMADEAKKQTKLE